MRSEINVFMSVAARLVHYLLAMHLHVCHYAVVSVSTLPPSLVFKLSYVYFTLPIVIHILHFLLH